MLSTPVLTENQVATFKRDGFVVVPGGFSPEQARTIDTWTRELTALPEEPGKHWVFHEESLKTPGQDLINRIEYFSPFHDGFRHLAEVLRAPVAQLLDEDAVLFKEKINFKMPGGDGFKPHQDSQAGWDGYADFFITAMVSIDASTVENGCLQLAAGHHEGGLYRSWEPLTDADMAEMNFTDYPTEPGDLVFFDCYAPHGSEPNMSDTIRRLYYATYNRRSAGDHLQRYYADKRKNFPPDIERDPDKEYVFRV